MLMSRFLAGCAAVAALTGLISIAAPAQAQVVWDDFQGNQTVGALRGTGNSYNNLTSVAGVRARLQAHASDPANVIRSGTSSNIDFLQSSDTLCNVERSGASTACTLDAMGRVMWARVQFPRAGTYNFNVSHDDEVVMQVSSDYQNLDYKNLSYNLAVGQLSSYTSNDSTYVDLANSVYAPQANACAWVRIYWNNNGGVNHLRMRWDRPVSDHSTSRTRETIPASAFLSTTGPVNCTSAVTASGTSVQLLKQVGETGRFNPADQFEIQILEGSTVVESAISNGSGLGTVAATGARLASLSTTYTLSEKMAAGSTGQLSDYDT